MLLILCVGGLLLRCHFAVEKSVGFDEWITVTMSLGMVHAETSALFNPFTAVPAHYFSQAVQQLAHQAPWSFGNILKCLEGDLNLPLYFLMMSGWLRIIPHFSPFWLRLPSILLGVASIPLFILLSKRLNQPKAGWIAATLFALAPFALSYGTDGRPYGFLIFLMLAGSVLIAQALRENRLQFWQWGLLIAIFWAGMLTHYFFIFPALFWTFLLFKRHFREKSFYPKILLAWLIPLIPIGLLLQQQLHTLAKINPLKTADPLGVNVSALIKGVSTVFFIFPPFDNQSWIGSLLFWLLLMLLIAQTWKNSDIARQNPIFSFCGGWLGLTLGGLLLAGLILHSRILEVQRYWTLVLPPFYLLLGALMTQGSQKFQKFAAFLLAGILVFFLAWFYQMQGYPDFNYRQVCLEILKARQPGDLVLTMAGYPTGPALADYLPPDMPIATMFRSDWQGNGNERLAFLTHHRKRVWFVATYNQLNPHIYDQALQVMVLHGKFQQKGYLITKPQSILLVLLERK